MFRNISERKSADRLRWELIHDQLTGLVNARHLNAALAARICQRRRERGGYSALLYIDLDRFTHCRRRRPRRGRPAAGRRRRPQLGRRLREDDVLGAPRGRPPRAAAVRRAAREPVSRSPTASANCLHQCKYETGGATRRSRASVGVAVISRETPAAEYVVEHARLACARPSSAAATRPRSMSASTTRASRARSKPAGPNVCAQAMERGPHRAAGAAHRADRRDAAQRVGRRAAPRLAGQRRGYGGAGHTCSKC